MDVQGLIQHFSGKFELLTIHAIITAITEITTVIKSTLLGSTLSVVVAGLTVVVVAVVVAVVLAGMVVVLAVIVEAVMLMELVAPKNKQFAKVTAQN